MIDNDEIGLRENVIIVKGSGKDYLIDLEKGKDYFLSPSGFMILEKCFLKGMTYGDVKQFFKKKYNDNNKTAQFIKDLEEKELISINNDHMLMNIIKDQTIKHAISSLFMEVTWDCNLKCEHCYARKDKINEMPISKIKEIIDFADRYGAYNVAFTGGEPTLRSDIFEILEYAKSKGFSVALFTNGTTLERKEIEKIKKLKVVNLMISLDGSNSSEHDKFRGVKGAFDKTINTIKTARELDIIVRANITITKLNYKTILRLLSLIEKLKVKEYRCGTIENVGKAKDKDLAVSEDLYLKLVKKIHKNEQNNKEISLVKPKEDSENMQYPYCGVGRSMLFIMADGTCSLCPTLTPFQDKRFDMGNVYKENLEKIWKRYMKYYEVKCKYWDKCDYKKFCDGGCRSSAFLRTGDILGEDSLKCKEMEALHGKLNIIRSSKSRK